MRSKLLIWTMACTLFAGCNDSEKKEEATADVKMYEPAKEEPIDFVARGEYLVNAIGCHDCHTPKKMTDHGPAPDMSRMLMGHPADEKLPPYDANTVRSYALMNYGLTAAIGPWGTSFAANITSDDTGIGAWTEAQFFNVMRKGMYKGMEGRPILPPMPWEAFKNLNDEDLKAIFAYLKSTKPIENVVPAAIPPKA